MGSVTEGEGSFRASIRKKDIQIYKSFKKREDALLWIAYKEDLIDNIQAFDPPLKEMITLGDAINLKIRNLKELGKEKREINDYVLLLKFFCEFIERPIGKITFDDLLSLYHKMLKIPVRRGGSQKNEDTGILKFPSEMTIFRKYTYLSTVYQEQIKNGLETENVPLRICQMRRQSLKTKCNSEE